MIYKATILFFLIGSIWAQEKSISGSTRRNRFSAGKSQAVDFNCPEDFGYYSHPSDCSQYYVCVFGGALLESCTGGLMYSTELQTCDWPRNVVCQTSTGPGVSTVKITDPRTQSRNTNTNAIHSATESLTSSSSILSRGIDNTIRTRQTPKSQGTSKSIFDDPSKGRQGRFLSNQGNDPQRIDNGFQAQETSSRAFNVVLTPPAPKVKFPPSLPGTSSGNRFSPARSSTKSPPQDSLYQDLLNLNDTDYYYYYDDILYDDYYDANSAKNKPTTTTTTASPFVRSRTPARSRGKASSKKSVSQSSLPSSSLTSRGRDSSRSSVSNTFKSPSSLKSNNPTSSFSSFPNAFSPSRSTGSKRGSTTSSTSKAGRKTQASSSKSAPRLSTNRHSLNQNTESASTALSPTLLPIPLIPSNKSKLNTSIPTKPSQNLSAITHKLKSSLKPNATSRSTSAKTKSNTVLPIGNDEENEIAKVKRLANVEKVKGDDFATNEVENSEVAERRKRPFPFATITVALMKNRGLSLRNGQKITPSSSLRNPFLRRSFNSTTTSKPTKIRNRNTGSVRRRISSVNRSLKPNKTSPESNKGNISARRISPTASLPNRKTEIFTNRKLNISNEVISRISERLQASEAKESLKNEETKGVHVIRKVTPVSKPMNVSSASNRNREESKAPTTTESRTFTVPTPERVLLQRQPIGRAKTRTKSIRNPPSLLRSRISNNRKDLANRASKFPVVPSNSRLPSTSSVLSNSRFQAKNRKEATVSKVESKSKTDLENKSDSSTSKIPSQSIPLKVVNIRNFSSSDETRNAIANAKLNPGDESEQNAANNKAKSITNSKLTQSLVPILVQTTNKNEDPKPVPEIKVSKRPIIPATSLSSTRSSSVKPIPTTDVLPKEEPSKQNTSSSQKKNRKPSPATVTFSQLRSPSFKLTNTSFKPVSEKFDIKSIPRDTTPRTILRPVITPRRPSISSSLKPTRNKPTIPKISETKDLNEASSNTSQETGLDRGSSRSKPKASSGSPKVVGRTPQR